MKILAIETSCDETAISVVNFDDSGKPEVLSHLVSSQTKIHEPFGGVVPNLAARAHQSNLVPILKKALEESGLLKSQRSGLKGPPRPDLGFSQGLPLEAGLLEKVLAREPELLKQFQEFIPTIAPPELDAIAVTVGPGLEPALWVGINFAKALALIWRKPLIPTNHMEGHIHSVLLPARPAGGQKDKTNLVDKIEFPAVALLISGGHTELILMRDWQNFELLGQTRDDAVGEAFDKVARLLGLPYPGGPQISALAEKFRGFKGQTLGAPKGLPLVSKTLVFPRPMLDSNNYDFSFSGLKTAVRYLVEKIEKSPPAIGGPGRNWKAEVAWEFQEAVIEVLVKKTMRAVREYGAKTLIVGGGVIANKKLRAAFESATKGQAFKGTQGLPLKLLIPEMKYTTDNATMIAVAAYHHFSKHSDVLENTRMLAKPAVLEPTLEAFAPLRAEGNLKVC